MGLVGTRRPVVYPTMVMGFWVPLHSVPLELLGQEESGLRYASKTNYRTENYQLARHVLENGLAALQVNLDEIQV